VAISAEWRDDNPLCAGAAFEEFYLRYQPLLFLVAVTLLSDRADAEDIVQAVFLKVWRCPEQFRGGNVNAWLTCVTRNAAIDLIRRRRMRDCLELKQDMLPNDPRSVEDEVLSSLEAYSLHNAIRDLPETQRSLVLESFWSGTSHERLAAATQLPLGTVKTRIRSGITRLRRKVARAVA
jgi:RNA polymerase sigma factor (sigma-70 family)